MNQQNESSSYGIKAQISGPFIEIIWFEGENVCVYYVRPEEIVSIGVSRDLKTLHAIPDHCSMGVKGKESFVNIPMPASNLAALIVSALKKEDE